MKQPTEPFSWGRRQFYPDQMVEDDDPAVGRFPHLFIDGTTGKVGEPEPVKRGPGRPRKVDADG